MINLTNYQQLYFSNNKIKISIHLQKNNNNFKYELKYTTENLILTTISYLILYNIAQILL